MRQTLLRAVAGSLSVLLLSAASAFAQAPKSTSAAADLVKLLDAAGLESIAAPDPANPDAWVAALYYKGSQLLVVSARYAAPSLLVEKLKTKQYGEIYRDLHSASVAGSRVFVMDSAADGLFSKPADAGADMWEENARSVVFDGDWRKSNKMSEADFSKTFEQADDRYAKMLSLLTAQAKGGSIGS